MPLGRTLRRIEREINQGEVKLPHQRLRGLMTTYRHDLAVREEIGRLYRMLGDKVEAGRCIYLREPRDEEDAAEQRAFERDALWRRDYRALHGLQWRRPASALPPEGQRRLLDLEARSRRRSGRWVEWDDEGKPHEYRTTPGKVIDVSLGLLAGLLALVVAPVLGVGLGIILIFFGIAWLVARATERFARK